MANDLGNDFPVWGLLPKKETGVISFLNKYPDYDGRGTIIAILDSGVDPGAPGLQKTSDGKTKIIHRFDCSGSGDVITNTVVEVEDGFITGLTGRKLKIPINWKNPSKNYRIGVKHAYELYPERLRDRIKSEYKEKIWEANQRPIVASANRDLAEFETKNSSSTLSDIDKMTKEDLEAKIELLNNFDKKFSDVGPVYDCVLFYDGDKWCCCVDTTEIGDLSKCPLLGEYSITHDYARLTKSDNLNFTINVHEKGDVLELVGLCSSHGTHVASIASAYFPDSPEQNGVAPGAQIVSLTIGDGRLGSMETGTALVRAAIKIMELSKVSRIHVINMSYGEHANWSDTGRIGEIINEIVNKYGIVWVASAGNHGPALSTIGTPPDISQETLIGVGAYVSPEMMVAEYSMRQKLPGMPYTWTSRGPTIDGGIGVSICAPGGAITSVPNFTLRYSQLMNGTSMASPHVAGAVSVLISGLLHMKLPYSPYSIKRSLEIGATYLDGIEVFAQGNGLLQVERSFDHAVNYHDVQERDIRFHITCGSSNSKGVFLRLKSTRASHCYNITVEPHFLDSDNVAAEIKIKFNMKLVLTSNAEYVSFPAHLDLSNIARVFAIKIDTSGLSSGVYSTFISAFDVGNVVKGAIFKIPVTIIIPQEVTVPKHIANFSDVAFAPNTIKRHFIHVPKNATWFVLRLSTSDIDKVSRFVIHCLQILPKLSCKTIDSNKTVTVTSNLDTVLAFQVRSEVTLEVVIAKYWANLGEITLNYSISFHGVKPNQPAITMHSADGIHSLGVSTLQGEEILPNIVLKNSVQIVKPTEGKVVALSTRDFLPPSRQVYELVLVYNFTLTKSTEVTPNLSVLSDVLYESEFESQFWFLFDSNKQMLGCGDAYPSKYSTKLDKGDYVIRLQVRHDKKEYLEKLTETPILLQQKLSSNITLDVYSNHAQAITSGKKASVCHGQNYMIVPFYIAPLPSDKFSTKSNNPAHYLSGYITYNKDEAAKKVDLYPFKYILMEGSSKKTATSSTSPEKEKTKLEDYVEAVRDLKLQWLSKLDLALAEKMYEEFVEEYADCLQVHYAYLQVFDPIDSKHSLPYFTPSENSSSIKETSLKVISICDKVIKAVDEVTLLSYFAMKTDTRTDASKIKSNMEQQRNILIESLVHKGISLCRLHVSNPDEYKLSNIDEIWQTLIKYVDPNDSKLSALNVLYFGVWYMAAHKFYGKALKYLLKLQEEKSNKENEEKIIEICHINNWPHVGNHFSRLLLSKFPSSYKQF